MEDDRDTPADANNPRYTSSCTPSASVTTSECASAPDISLKSLFCVSLGEQWEDVSVEKPPEYSEDVVGLHTCGAFRYTTTSESEVFDSVAIDDIDKRCDKSMHASNCNTPSLSAVLSVSLPTQRSSKDLRHRLHRRGSLHHLHTSSQASDRTMIDHGSCVDAMNLLTPDQKATARRDLVKAYLSRSSGGRLRQSLGSDKLGFKSHFARHDDRSNINAESSKGVAVGFSSTRFSFVDFDDGRGGGGRGVGVGGDNDTRNSSAVCRSRSCPVKFNHLLTTTSSNDNLARTVSYFPLELRDSYHTSVRRSRNAVVPIRPTDDMNQYRLAIQSIKKGRYGLTLREILANQGVDDDDDDDDDDDVVEEEDQCLESFDS